jgi:nitroreductase/dihydropteridine reductase
MNLLDALKWRYATKKMNGKKVPQEKVDQILEAARLAPTSSGLQPYQVIIITNPDLKQSLLAHANNQSQVIDSSHLLIFAAWDNYTEERIKNVFIHSNKERGLPDSATADFEKSLINLYVPRTAEENFQHAARQAYIGFGLAIAQAALLQVDASPMEGFNGPEIDKVLNLKAKGLRSVTLLPLGYRDESGDWLVNMKKVRRPAEEFFIEFN